MMKIIALRHDPNSGKVLAADEFTSAVNALGIIEQENAELRSVGYSREWVVYLVDGSDWLELSNYVHSWARFDFMEFLRSVGGKYAGFDVENFEAPDREDF